MIRKYSIFIIFFLSLISLNSHAEGNAAAGKEKSQLCAACHGVDGNSSNPIWPKLAGQHIEYIVKQLTDYKSGSRENAQMSPMATNLSEQDMLDIAAYYSSQKIKHDKTDPAGLVLGQKIYRAGSIDAFVPACTACHGPNGRGNPAALYPALGGQHAAYTQAQLNAFRESARTNDNNSVMRTIVGRMTDEEIKAVSEYIQGLH
jgi:cytochrome c553